jgi:hypothetical protein
MKRYIFLNFQLKKALKIRSFQHNRGNENYFFKDSFKRMRRYLSVVRHDYLQMPIQVYLSVYRFIKTKCEKLEYFPLIERPKKLMERHVTFLIFKNLATRREVSFLSVDDFKISKSTPDKN